MSAKNVGDIGGTVTNILDAQDKRGLIGLQSKFTQAQTDQILATTKAMPLEKKLATLQSLGKFFEKISSGEIEVTEEQKASYALQYQILNDEVLKMQGIASSGSKFLTKAEQEAMNQACSRIVMSQYTAPDGTVFNIPSDPAEKEQLSNALKKVYPGADIDAVVPTLGGRVAEFGKAIPRGGLATLASAIKGPVALLDVGDDSALYKGITDFEKYLQEDSALAPEAGYEDLYSTKLGGAFGSFVPFLGAGMVGGALAKAGTLSARAGMYGVPAGLAIPAGMGQQADLIEASRGLGEEVGGVKETLATLLGGAVGLTEILPVANILKKVPKKALEDLAY
jgi:hypothetical protein